jgi:hypothetical protein
MNKEDITDWLRAVYLGQYSFKSLEEAFRSAWEMGAAAEREACNKAVYEAWDESGSPDAWRCVEALRARGQV